ncbi:MAG: serine hydroxymethyltransferase [Polyangiaceae bacterium]|nr:serine hydroxymethyltransferase [Polyangiaceae bacterium]MCW5789207.1 serine hydroxymethyltransferase [Polyangiaceae bacterium]
MPALTDPALKDADPTIAELIAQEERRETDKLRLIASENYASRAVLEATGSVLANKYSEGYAGKRYYEGQQIVDQVELLAIARIRELFGAEHVNVQPYSGSPANLAVYLAFCQPGDPVLGLALPAGGHLTHGWGVSITGKYFASQGYGVRREDQRIDFDDVRRLALEHRPKLLWCGTTAYPRLLDFARFREIADEVGAILCADIAHIAGLVAGGVHPSPVGIADVVTSTTHKTFRGPRGGMILCKEEHARAIDRAVFPGLQGGPHNHTTAGIAVAAGEALKPEFKSYAQGVVDNAKALAEALLSRGFDLVTGGTDNHLILIDLTSKQVPGKVAAQALDRAGIVANYNSVPFDPRKPFDPSGLRIGTPSLTSRGMGPGEMVRLADFMDQVVKDPSDEPALARIAGEVRELCSSFPPPGIIQA